MQPLRTAVIVDQVAVARNPHEESLPLQDLALSVVDLIEQIDIAVFVDRHLASHKIRNGDGNPTATGPLRDHVDEFLRKGVEHDTPGTLAPLASDCVESSEPVECVRRFP